MTVCKRVPRSYKGLKRSLQLLPAECSTGEEDKHRERTKKVVTGKRCGSWDRSSLISDLSGGRAHRTSRHEEGEGMLDGSCLGRWGHYTGSIYCGGEIGRIQFVFISL